MVLLPLTLGYPWIPKPHGFDPPPTDNHHPQELYSVNLSAHSQTKPETLQEALNPKPASRYNTRTYIYIPINIIINYLNIYIFVYIYIESISTFSDFGQAANPKPHTHRPRGQEVFLGQLGAWA